MLFHNNVIFKCFEFLMKKNSNQCITQGKIATSKPLRDTMRLMNIIKTSFFHATNLVETHKITTILCSTKFYSSRDVQNDEMLKGKRLKR